MNHTSPYKITEMIGYKNIAEEAWILSGFLCFLLRIWSDRR